MIDGDCNWCPSDALGDQGTCYTAGTQLSCYTTSGECPATVQGGASSLNVAVTLMIGAVVLLLHC